MVNSIPVEDIDSFSQRLDKVETDIDVTTQFPNQVIRDIVINNSNNIDALYEIMNLQDNKLFNYIQNWVIVNDESEIFETINGVKVFKNDTFVYYNTLGSELRGYFIKGFPKDRVKLVDTYIDTLGSENITVVTYTLRVINDTFRFYDHSFTFDFNENPIKSSDETTITTPEYGSSYSDDSTLLFSIRKFDETNGE